MTSKRLGDGIIKLALALFLAVVLAAWVIGIVRLFQKHRKILAWIALSGIIIPFVAPIGFIGWFIRPKSL
ncbi:MAG: hypothetical protein ACC652_08740 [Acidimicrobiales bacterium]